MKHLKEAEKRVSDTRGFLWTYTILAAIPKALKIIILCIWMHTCEIVMAAALLGVIFTYRALNAGNITETIAILFTLILAALFAAMLKIKLIEIKKKDR